MNDSNREPATPTEAMVCRLVHPLAAWRSLKQHEQKWFQKAYRGICPFRRLFSLLANRYYHPRG